MSSKNFQFLRGYNCCHGATLRVGLLVLPMGLRLRRGLFYD